MNILGLKQFRNNNLRDEQKQNNINMEILFISSRDVNSKSHGGYQCTNRNYMSFCELLGFDNVKVHNLNLESKNSLLKKILRRVNILLGFYPGLSYKKIQEIIQISKNYKCIFIDSSCYGVIAYYLKKRKYNGKIICFFHNVEYKIQLQKAKINPLGFLMIFLVHYNERMACKYSNEIVVLADRDFTDLQKIYGIRDIHIIPISMTDTFKYQSNENVSIPPTCLFIGNYWYANIHGLDWFVNNVLDEVDIKLQIVGTGMDELREKYSHPKIEFLGFVSNLSSILINADYFICPIFLGSGMKVKTCEALMYGKNIIGTKEAFEGYEVDYKKVGALCNTKEEFILAIKNICNEKKLKFNLYSRNYFLEKYSFKATLKKFAELLPTQFNNIL